jgi:ubiquinone/menaquinone biosynthesis C-methylase UbiE
LHDLVHEIIADSPLYRMLLKEALGSDYPPLSLQFSFVGNRAVDRVVEVLKALPPGPCLDVGCGEGSLTSRIAVMAQRPMIGCDISSSAIKAAQTKRNIQCSFLTASFRRLPFQDGSFPAICALDCVQNAEPADIAAEIARVCAPGGGFLFSYWPLHRSRDEIETLDIYGAALAAHGFAIVDAFDIDPGLAKQFAFYQLVARHRIQLTRELGADLVASFLYEADRLREHEGRHLLVWAIRQHGCRHRIFSPGSASGHSQ